MDCPQDKAGSQAVHRRALSTVSVILTHDPIENENENARAATTDDDGERDR